jgi:hypothetical protein
LDNYYINLRGNLTHYYKYKYINTRNGPEQEKEKGRSIEEKSGLWRSGNISPVVGLGTVSWWG